MGYSLAAAFWVTDYPANTLAECRVECLQSRYNRGNVPVTALSATPTCTQDSRTVSDTNP